ncbi:PREDICTED: uncharacterized protein LOC109478316 [Branchiostoma belcheri]|uniref:Uncharacterized protein LOC109478316 n=1 Tax=Branchiostoma belcheri TaxID=7741 RepID=A0A6P4Z1B1_BRABE|nr:PREDICTED: uncharacterized protein LOC109478316 [Branchiostoma belcheri]
MAASSQAGRRCALPVKKRQAARKVKMKDDMLRPVSLDSHEAQEIQFACKRTCWDVKNFEYQITDIQLVENDVLQSEFLQKQHELSVEGRSPKELIEEFAFLDVTDKTKRSAVCNSGLTTALSDTANSALGEPSQGVTVWRCPDLCIQKETEGGPKNHVVAMFKIMRGRPRTVVPQSNLGLPPKPAQNFDSHVPCVVFSGADDMTSAMQIYLYELNKVDHKPLTRPRHCCPYAIIFYKNKASQKVTSTKPAKVAKISKPVTPVTKQQQPASGRRLIPFGEKMVTYSIAWSGTLTNKDKELGRVDFLAGQGCKVPSLGTKVVRVSSKMSLSSLRDVLPPECLKNVGSAWDKRLRHESWRYNVLVVRPVQESRDTMARFCAFLRQSNSATVSTLLVSGAPAPVKLFLIPSCKFTEDLGLGACSDHGKMFAILSYKVLPPSSSTHSKQKNKKNSKEKTGMPLTEKQPFTTDYVDNDFVHDDYDVGDQLPSLVNSFNTNVFTSVFNLEKPALKQMDQNTLKKTEPKSEDKQGKDSTITDGSQAGSRVKDTSMQQPFRDISSGVVPNTEGRGRQRNGVLEQSNFADDASVGSRRSAEAPSQVLSAVDNAIPVDPRLARRRQPSSESNTSSIENRTPPMETPQSPDSISMTIPERDFVETESTTSHISSGKQLDITSQSVQEDKAAEQPEIPLVKKPSNAVTPKNDEDSAVTQTLGESVKSSNEVKKTSVTPPTQAFLPKKRPVRGVFAHLKNKGPSHSATASLHLDTDLETVDLATTQRPRRSGIPFGSALKITVKNQNVLKENNKDCSTETKVIKKMKTDDTRSDAVVSPQMAEWSPTKQTTGDNYDNVMMDLDSDTAVHEGEDQEQKEKRDKCEETQRQNSESGATEMEKSETNTHKHSKEEKGENDNTKKAAFDGPGRKKTDTEEAGTLIVPTHHRYNQGDSFYRANLIRNPWLDDNEELMQYRHVVPKGATNISPPRKGVAKEQKDNNSQAEQIQDQGQHQQIMGNNGVESEVNHSHRHKATTSEGHSKEACSGGKLLMPDYLKAAQKVGAEDVKRNDVQETTKKQLDSQQTAAQVKDVKSREQRTHRNSSSSSTFSRSRSKSKSRTVNQTRSRSRSLPRGRNRTKSRNRRNPITRKRSTSRKSPRRRRSRSRSRQRDRSRSKSKDSPQGARSDGKAIPRARRSGISVPAIGRNVFPGSRMNITSPYRRKRPERRKRSSSSSSSDSSERPRKAYSQLDRCRRSRIRRNRTKRTCRSSDQRSSRDENSSSCSPERRSKRRLGSRSNRSSESNDQQEGGKGNASHDRQEKKHDTEGQGKSRKAASPEKKCTEKDSRDPNQCSEEKKLMSKEKIDLVERVLFLTTGKMVKFDYADRVHRHLFRLDIESLQQEAKRLAINKGLSEDWLKEEFVCQPGSDEEEDEKPTDKHISTMTRGAIVYEILQLRKELNLTSGYNPNYMFKNIRRKDLIASLEKLRAAKQEILASSAWNMTKASLKVKKEAPKIFTTDTGCGENPVEILLQRKGDAIVKVVKDFVTHNKSMGLPVNMDKEEMTPKQLMGARCDDEHMESALNVFPNDPRCHSDVHMVDMQNNNAASEAPKKKLSIAETMARSLEDSGPGTLQDNAVEVEVVVAVERSPQTQHDPMPVKQAWSAPQPISPTPGNLTLQCSDIPAGGVSQATYATGVGEETLRKAPVLVSHREKCLDCSAQPEQTPVKMANQHQGNKPHSVNITATSGGQDRVPVDPRLRSNAKEFHDVTGSNNRDPSQGQSDAVGSVGAVRRNLLENELSDRAVGPGKDRGADFSPCDTTSGSGENSPEVLQMAAPQVDCDFLPPTKEEGIGPISPTGSDRELYKEKESNPHWFVNTERQPEKSRVGNDSSLVSPAGWYGSAVDNNSNCMQGKVPMREQVGLHSRSYPVQKPEWRQKLPWQEQGRSDNYSSPQVKSAVKPGWDSKIKAPVFPRPQKHHSSVGPRQVQNRRPPHVHPVPRMPYPRFQQHSQTRPPHPSPPHRPPPHYSQQQTSPQRLHQHPPMSPCRPPLSSPRHGCIQTPPRPLLNNVTPRPHHGPPTHTGGFMSAGQYNYKDTATEVNNKRTTDSQTPPRPLMNVSPRPHRGPPPHTGGFMSAGQYNQKNTGTEVNNNRSDFQQDYGEQCRTPPSYPTQGRGMACGCPRGGGRGQPFPHPARGRAGLSGYPVRGGCPQRGRGGFRGRGFMAGAVQGRGRAQSAW